MILYLVVFSILFVVTVLCVGLGQAVLATHQKQQVKTMLRRAATVTGKRRLDLVRDQDQVSGFGGKLAEIALFDPLRARLHHAQIDWSLEKFLLLTAGAAFLGLVVGECVPALSRIPALPFGLALVASVLPYWQINRARLKRFNQFEEQFPGALDFLSRAMRAGHAFSIGLEMLVADAPNPLGSCFRRVLQSLQLGSPMEVALAELMDIMPIMDVQFFVTAVLLQQGTGGNLGEILESMSQVIRERFQLKGAVKAASAHGRITSLVLTAMPIVVAMLLMVSSPDYLRPLVTDPTGKKLLTGAICGQFIGYLFIRKITNIKV